LTSSNQQISKTTSSLNPWKSPFKKRKNTGKQILYSAVHAHTTALRSMGAELAIHACTSRTRLVDAITIQDAVETADKD
jgi:hypothetical protein